MGPSTKVALLMGDARLKNNYCGGGYELWRSFWVDVCMPLEVYDGIGEMLGFEDETEGYYAVIPEKRELEFGAGIESAVEWRPA